MDQDLNQLTRELQKQHDSTEKLIGMFAGMVKRQDQADKSDRARARSSNSSDGSGITGSFKKDFREASGAIQGFDAVMAKAAGGVSGSLKMLSRDISGATNAFQSLAKNVLGATIGGVLIGGITQYTTGLITTYKDLSEYGQTFSDGMFGLAKAAMSGQVSMEEYSRMAKRNSVVMAQMGNKNGGFAGLAAEVRQNSEQFGMFGYTMSGLNDLAGDYMETLRMQGRLDKLSKQDAVKNLGDLAETTTLLSAAFGKSRKDITDTAQGVLRSASGAIAMGMMTPEEMKKFGPAVESAVTALASQAGEAGKMLPKFLMDTMAANGNEVFTDTGKLIAKLMPQASGLTSQLAADVKAAGNDQGKIMHLTNEYNRKMKDTLDSQMSNLQVLHMQGGAIGAEADQLITALSGIKVYQQADLDAVIARAKASEKSMKLWGSIENTWARFSSGLLSKLFPLIEKPLEAIASAFDAFEKNGGADTIVNALKGVGEAVDAFVRGFVSDDNMKRLKDQLVEWLGSFAEFIKSFTPGTAVQQTGNVQNAESMGKQVFDTFAKLKVVIDDVGSTFKWLSNNIEKVTTVLMVAAGTIAAAMVGIAGFNLFKSIKNIISMSVTAKNVIIKGEGSGWLDNLLGKDKKGGRGGDHGPHGPRGGGGGGRRGWFSKVLGLGGTAAGLAAGATDVMDVVKDHITDAADKVKPTDAKGEVKPAEAKPATAAEVKPGEVKPVEPATPRTAAPEVKAEAAIPKAEVAPAGGIKGWAQGLLGGFKGNGLLGGAMHGLGLASAAYDIGTGAMEATAAFNEYTKGGSGADMAKSLINTIVPRAVGWAGALVGGAAGTAGGLITGPGAIATGALGGSAGYMAGSWAGEGVAKDLNKLVDYFTKPSSPSAPAAPANPRTPAPAVLSDAQTHDLQAAQASVTERLQNLERAAQSEDPNAKKQLEVLQQLLDMMKDGTGINAAFLQKITDAVNGGNRRLVNAVTTTPR